MHMANEFGCAQAVKTKVPFPVDPQTGVAHHFQATATDWERIYHASTVYGSIYQDRMQIALRWIEQLRLSGMARLLEIGCGAGFATAALAKRGYRVDALDNAPAMIDLTRKRLTDAGVSDRVRILEADVRHLPMPDNSFDLTFALGVLPWLDDPYAAVCEMVRVTRQDGFVLLSSDNSVHLGEMLDPMRAPILKPVRHYVASALRRAKLLSPAPPWPKIQRHSRRQFDSILADAGLDKLQGLMVGFGPFTLFGKSVLPDPMGIKVHRLLQAAANRKWPIVSFYGTQYLVMATKPGRLQ